MEPVSYRMDWSLRGQTGRASAWRFWQEALRGPRRIGALAPTTRGLACEFVRRCGVESADAIVELGAGTGIITEQILRWKRPDASVLAVERDAGFAWELSRRFPGVEVAECCASRLGERMETFGFEPAGSVVSTLPWGIFEPELQWRILRQARHALAPGGTFGTIACFGWHWLGAGRCFRNLLGEAFGAVTVTRVFWNNVPPAFLYLARRPA
jgi:phospholipid N-methyltransferase